MLNLLNIGLQNDYCIPPLIITTSNGIQAIRGLLCEKFEYLGVVDHKLFVWGQRKQKKQFDVLLVKNVGINDKTYQIVFVVATIPEAPLCQ